MSFCANCRDNESAAVLKVDDSYYIVDCSIHNRFIGYEYLYVRNNAPNSVVVLKHSNAIVQTNWDDLCSEFG